MRVSVNEQRTEELHKPVIKKIQKEDNIWEADLAEMESFSSKNKNIKCLLRAIHAFTKYAWIKPLTDK